jgi:glycosyltransferase involved in cell wall biosynthesis
MNLNLIGPINKMSYGIVTRNLVKALVDKYHISLFPVNQTISDSDFEESELNNLRAVLDNSKFFDVKAPCVRIWHQFDMAQFVGKGKHIGWPIFELDVFKDQERHHLSSVDEIFVCSQWAKNICEDNFTQPVHVVPLGVDSTIFNHKPIEHDVFTMHSIGKIEIRKSHELIPLILDKAFRKDDKFLLKMMWRNAFTDNVLGEDKIKEWEEYYRTYLGNRVEFSPHVQYNKQVAEFINGSDLGLYLSKAEGWDLSCLETIACGVNIVATNYSGHTEYLTDKNAQLIDVQDVCLADDGLFFDGFGYWANVESYVEEIAEKIRDTYDRWKGGNLQTNYEGIKTAELFSWNNTVKQMGLCL